MSSYKAYVSWANHVKEALSDSGINVLLEKHEPKEPPYLYIEDGPEILRGPWMSKRLCQGTLVVEYNEELEPLKVTMGKAMEIVFNATKDLGTLEKWDYSVDPAVVVGGYIPQVMEISDDQSRDPLRSRKAITWILRTSTT